LWSEGFTLKGGVPGPLVTVNSTTTGDSVEFPVLAKVRVGLTPGVNMFLGAGPSLRRLFGITERGQRTVRTFLPAPESTETTVYETDSPETFDRRTWLGLAISAGVEFRAGPLRLGARHSDLSVGHLQRAGHHTFGRHSGRNVDEHRAAPGP
jgi:hypothetical protein